MDNNTQNSNQPNPVQPPEQQPAPLQVESQQSVQMLPSQPTVPEQPVSPVVPEQPTKQEVPVAPTPEEHADLAQPSLPLPPVPVAPLQSVAEQGEPAQSQSSEPVSPMDTARPTSGMNKLFILAAVGVGVTALSVGAFTLHSRTKTLGEYKEMPKSFQNAKTTTPSPAENTSVASNMTLSLVTPGDKSNVTTAVTTVQGTTAAGAEVFVNDVELKADSTGNFSTPLSLNEGVNTITITVNDSAGNYAEKTLTVTYQPTQ